MLTATKNNNFPPQGVPAGLLTRIFSLHYCRDLSSALSLALWLGSCSFANSRQLNFWSFVFQADA